MLQEIYDKSPVFLQNIMCSVKGEINRRRRFGKGFFNYLDLLENRQINAEKELGYFLKSVENVPAYKKIFDKARKDGRKVKLEDFPIINKLYVKEHYEDFINKGFRGRTVMMHTGGTTGSGLVFPHSVDFENRQWATWWRYFESLGIKYGTWAAVFNCAHMVVPISQRKPPYWRVNRPCQQLICSPYHICKDTVQEYVEEIEKRGIVWVHGYASNVRYLCNVAIDAGLKPMTNIKYVTTGAENLLPACVTDIQRFFPNAIIRTHYGQTEGVANFSMTKEGNWVVDDDMAYVELIPVSKDEPERCRIIGTSFGNLAFPLIRYDIGDIAIVDWSNGKPTIQYIEGRDNEYFVLADGTKISNMRVYDIFKESSNVIEAQIRVKAPDNLELVIVKSDKYCAKDEKDILCQVRKYFTGKINVTLRYVDSIERAASGKFRALISDMSKEQKFKNSPQ